MHEDLEKPRKLEDDEPGPDDPVNEDQSEQTDDAPSRKPGSGGDPDERNTGG